MFVGHYSVAFATRQLTPNRSLGWHFFAVQFLDVLWAPAVLLGIEHARVVPGFLPASPLDLYYMPWTHSLVMALAWSWLFFRFMKAPILALCVFSHWVLDFVAHQPDLPLLRGAPYFGLGLWHFRNLTFIVEVVLLVLGYLVYMRGTRPRSPAGGYAMGIFVGALVLVEAINIYGPAPGSVTFVAIGAEASYLAFAAIAWRLDRLREVITEEPLRLNLTA